MSGYEFSFPTSPRVALRRYARGYGRMYRWLNRRRAWRLAVTLGLGIGAPCVAKAARELHAAAWEAR